MIPWIEIAGAAPLLVRTTAELEAAVAAFLPGDEIVVDGAYGGPIDAAVRVDRRIVIRGVRGAVLRATGGADGALWIDAPGATVLLRDLVVEGAPGHRALRVQHGTLRLEDVIVREGDFDGSGGGAIRVDATATALVLVRGQVRGSRTAREGGCVAILGGRLDVDGTSFRQCVAGERGGAIAATGAALDLSGARFDACSGSRGGAIAADAGSAVTLRGVWFEGDEATVGDGGAVSAEGAAASIAITDCTFRGNLAADAGGALWLGDGGTVVRGLFCDNAGVDGAAIAVVGSASAVRASIFLDNVASGEGALWSRAPLEVSHAAFWSNRGGGNGHALVSRGTDVALEDSVVFDHPNGAVAFWANTSPGDVVRYTAVFDNRGGNASPSVDRRHLVTADPGLAPTGACEPTELRPPPGSPLIGAGRGGSDLGPYDGGSSWDGADRDVDGDPAATDCDDLDPRRFHGNVEAPSDGVDGDCDGAEWCFLSDDDGDGLGDGTAVPTADPSCELPPDPCPGDPDNVDTDADGACDPVDPCWDDPSDSCAPGGSGGAVHSGGSGTSPTEPTADTGLVPPPHTGSLPESSVPTGDTAVPPRPPGLLPPDPGCGCGSAPRPGGLFPGLLALAARRRRGGRAAAG